MWLESLLVFNLFQLKKKCPIISGIRFVDDGILNVMIQDIRMNIYITKYLLMPVCLTKKDNIWKGEYLFQKNGL